MIPVRMHNPRSYTDDLRQYANETADAQDRDEAQRAIKAAARSGKAPPQWAVKFLAKLNKKNPRDVFEDVQRCYQRCSRSNPKKAKVKNPRASGTGKKGKGSAMAKKPSGPHGTGAKASHSGKGSGGMGRIARKRKSKGGKRKKRRTAAQRRATAKLIRHNKRRRTRRHGRRTPPGAHPVPAKRRTRAKSRRHTKWRKVKGYRKGKKSRVTGKTRRHGARRHYRRTNPALPLWAQVLVGAGIGVGVSALTTVAARKLAPAKSAMLADVAALATIGAGIYVARKRPLLGASLAAGAAGATFVPQLAAKVEAMTAGAGTPEQAVAQDRLSGLQFLHGMHAPKPAFGMGAVSADMGAVAAQLGALGYDDQSY